MLFKDFALYCSRIEQVSSRLEITRLLSELFTKLTPVELKETTYLLQGRVGPLYEAVEFGMGEKLVVRAVCSALNIERSYFMTELKKQGDVGKVTEQFKKLYHSFEEKDLTISEVFSELRRLSVGSGEGSQEARVGILAGLISQLDSLSSLYLVRIPQDLLRLGFSDMTVLDAYSWMLSGGKTLRTQIERAYLVRPDIGWLGKELKEQGIKAVESIEPQVGTPIIMMRAERLSTGAEIIKQIGTCAVESKYDGFRIQIHLKKQTDSKNASVRLYSRNLENVTHMYPDLVQAILREVMVKDDAIFEAEAVGMNPKTGELLPFQDTVQRKRKYDIEEKMKEIPLVMFCFDLLYADGKSYVMEPFSNRRKKLESMISLKASICTISPQKVVSTADEVEVLFDIAAQHNLEGVIAKKLDGIYQPGARAWNWIKYKRSYSSALNDTVDVLVMGYDVGKGKRTDFGIGAFLVGVMDEASQQYVTVAKIGTGLSDIEWQELKKRCHVILTKKKPDNYVVDPAMEVDQWVIPSVVVEIRADEITRSPVHTAGRTLVSSKSGKSEVVGESGYSLRFPRLERFRDDKRPEDTTTLTELIHLSRNQMIK